VSEAGSRAPARIRPGTPADFAQIVRHWSAITRHHEPIDPLFRQREDAEPWIRDLVGQMLRDPDTAVFVAEFEEGEPGCLAGICVVRIDRAPPILEETVRAEVTDLGVAPELRRRGIGRSLAEAALAWVRERGVGRVEVRVAAGNPEGQAFWRALGFGELFHVLHRRLGPGGQPAGSGGR